jgi:uncharacterized membrane protein YgcG
MNGDRPVGRALRTAAVGAVGVLVWWGLLFGLYVVLVSTVPSLELMVGAGLALLGALAAEAVRRAEHPRVRGSRRVAAAVAAFPLTLLRETGQLAAAVARVPLGRPQPGRTLTIRLPPGTDAACAAALLSASPGACVIDIESPSPSAPAGDGPTPARGPATPPRTESTSAPKPAAGSRRTPAPGASPSAGSDPTSADPAQPLSKASKGGSGSAGMPSAERPAEHARDHDRIASDAPGGPARPAVGTDTPGGSGGSGGSGGGDGSGGDDGFAEGARLVVHVLSEEPSRVERALGGRRSG